MKPQEPIPHNYSMGRLNAIFAFSALGLLLVTGLIVMYDYVRGWKWFQLEFMRIQQERIEQNLRTENEKQNKTQLANLDAQIKQQELEIARNRNQYVLAQRDLDTWEGKHYAADEDYRFAKAKLDAQRYNAEASMVEKRADTKEQQAEYKRQTDHVNQLLLNLQDVTRKRDAAQANVNVWLKKITDIENKKKELNASIDLLNKQLDKVAANTNFFVLNAPMLDFVAPTFKIDQVVLPDLFMEMNYMSVPRVDRCQTCHRGIERPGFYSNK
jgi:hypothetical protein